MRIIVIVVALAAVAAFWLVTKSRAQVSTATKTDPPKTKPADPKDVYVGLRNTMLTGSRSKFNLAPTSTPTEPWGVAMDWGVERGIATVVALSDGSASVYLSSGGGYIGGKGQEPIRKAAQEAVELARTAQPPTHLTAAYPLPQSGGVTFYLLTDAGVFTANTTQSQLNSSMAPLRKLGDAMQEVITQYRLWSEQQKPQESK